MKWKEMTAAEKVLRVISFGCGAAFIVLFILVLCGIPGIKGILEIVDKPLMGIFWLLEGILRWKTDKKTAIVYIVCAAIYAVLFLVEITLL